MTGITKSRLLSDPRRLRPVASEMPGCGAIDVQGQSRSFDHVGVTSADTPESGVKADVSPIRIRAKSSHSSAYSAMYSGQDIKRHSVIPITSRSKTFGKLRIANVRA